MCFPLNLLFSLCIRASATYVTGSTMPLWLNRGKGIPKLVQWLGKHFLLYIFIHLAIIHSQKKKKKSSNLANTAVDSSRPQGDFHRCINMNSSDGSADCSLQVQTHRTSTAKHAEIMFLDLPHLLKGPMTKRADLSRLPFGVGK